MPHLPEVGFDKDEHAEQLDFPLKSLLSYKQNVQQVWANMLTHLSKPARKNTLFQPQLPHSE